VSVTRPRTARPAAAIGAAALALATGAAGCHRGPSAPPPPPVVTAPADGTVGPPRLVVLIVIDQLPRWGFEARRGQYRDGLARLLRDGTLLTAAYPYATTFTAPGHAALGTGAPPAVTGVVANVWYRRALGGERLAEADDDAPILAIGDRAPTGATGASARALRVPGIADALRAATGGRGRSVAIAGKPRAACFVLGRSDVALWYEPALVGFTSSRAFMPALPPWAVALDRDHPLTAALTDVWTLDDPAAMARATGLADDAAGEAGDYGATIGFPHALAATADPARALRGSPVLDRAEVDAALAAVAGEHLGADDVPDLLAVSFSAHDYVGHAWGQESWEMLDLERRLDRELGRLLTGLDRAVGAGRYAVVLTSDHGATRMVERGHAPGARRLAPSELAAVAEAAAVGVLGAAPPSRWIAAVSSGMVYLGSAWQARSAADRAAARAAIVAALAAVPQVARVIDLDALPADCAPLPDLDARACRTRVAGESGELLIVPTEGSLIVGGATGTAHDAPSLDTALVPLILVTPDRRPLVTAADPPVSILRVAPTLAALLGVPAPAAATAAPLVSATAAPTSTPPATAPAR